jgi:hypothetical protein
MIKQFIHSLKGNAFDWYINLEFGSIDSWEQLERSFLTAFAAFVIWLAWLNSSIHVSGRKSLTSTTCIGGETLALNVEIGH